MKQAEPVMLVWRVWRFSGVTVPQADKIVVRRASPWRESENEFCRIVATVPARTPNEALEVYYRDAAGVRR